jgi:glycosyltransferase involved in cell wall biosynthesis
MKVSIAMTTYNSEIFVQEQLLSLFHQTHQPDEVIIFDDHSQDNTPHIVAQFIEQKGLKNWHLSINQQNIGFIENFYNAIQATTGDVIFLCDQDDVWHDNKIEEMVAVLKANPQIAVLNTAVRLMDENEKGLSIKHKKGWSNENMLYRKVKENELVSFDFKFLSRRNISPGCSLCFSKKTKELFLGNKQNTIPHDWFINMLGSLQQGTFFYNLILTSYRIHQQNAIGVDIDAPLSIQTTQEQKLKTATKFYTRSLHLKEFLEKENSKKNLSFINKYIQFLKRRVSFFNTLSISDFIGMLKHWRTYHFVFGTRMMVSDFIYLLRLDGLLKKKN